MSPDEQKPLSPDEKRLLADALAFALWAHGDQTRKGSNIPYASHLLQVAGLVLEHGGDVHQAVAGLLHDTVEDCDGVTPEIVEDRFGKDVARIVEVCTDTLPGDTASQKSAWRTRKKRYLERLKAADDRTLLVAICDKRHNLGTIVADVRRDGLESLERFSAGPEEQVWYFQSVLELSRQRHPTLPVTLHDDIERLVSELREFLGV